MKKVESQHYIKGMHNLLNAHFMLQNHVKFNETLHQFEMFYHSKEANSNNNNQVQSFVYLYIAKINKHFLEGSFSQGLKLVPHVEEKLEEHELLLDRHRILVFYYKLACLYFGAGNYDKTIEYLNRIINWKVDLRTDLQCYARLLHLIAHYELGNYDILEYLVKSVYRFMSKMQNLSVVEKEIFKFLQHTFHLDRSHVRIAFEKLRDKLQNYEENPLESRSFMYLDIISWLDSKIRNVPVQDIIREKYQQREKVRK
jgi:tetratricopeptide (TPR) repeat protein